jgi:hypothetical protein
MKLFAVIITTVLATTTGYASAGNAIPSTAKDIGVITGKGFDKDDSVARSNAIQSAANQISQEMDGFNVEYECRSVYRLWRSFSDSTSSINNGDVLNTHSTYYYATLSIDVLCDPRGFQEKVAISAEKACEKDPKPECMSHQYLDMFSKIKNTAYYDLNRP